MRDLTSACLDLDVVSFHVGLHWQLPPPPTPSRMHHASVISFVSVNCRHPHLLFSRPSYQHLYSGCIMSLPVFMFISLSNVFPVWGYRMGNNGGGCTAPTATADPDLCPVHIPLFVQLIYFYPLLRLLHFIVFGEISINWYFPLLDHDGWYHCYKLSAFPLTCPWAGFCYSLIHVWAIVSCSHLSLCYLLIIIIKWTGAPYFTM